MSDIKLFQLRNGKKAELQGDASGLNKPPIQRAYQGRRSPA